MILVGLADGGQDNVLGTRAKSAARGTGPSLPELLLLLFQLQLLLLLPPAGAKRAAADAANASSEKKDRYVALFII